MLKRIVSAAALGLVALSAFAQGEETPATEAEAEAAYQAFAQEVLAGVTPEQGRVTLKGAPVTLAVTGKFDFYDAAETRTILEDLWGNPPDDTVLGMVFPAGVSPADSAWGALFTYEETGYVSDDDAASTDYDALLAEMQAGTRDSNAARVEEGFDEIELVGWAVPPSYDAASHRVIWAKDLVFSSAEGEHTLNYDMRLLGRSGVLSVNMIGVMDVLPEVRAAGPEVLSLAAFDAGKAYADYVEGDKTAGYGVAALIAGGAGAAVLKKAGLLAIVLAFLKKGFVLIPLALAGLWRLLRGRFGGGKEK